MNNHVREIIPLLPYTVREKVRHYLDYVHDRMIDKALEEDVYHRVNEVRDAVEVLFTVRLLYGYFVIGFRNHNQMLRFFAGKQVSGFQIGSLTFTPDSLITAEWQQLVNEFESFVSDAEIRYFVNPNVSMDEALGAIMRPLSEGQAE